MGIKVLNFDEISKKIDRFGEVQVTQMIINRFERAGLKFIIYARTLNTYKDQTAQLRSSIGYVIAYNGRILKSNFSKDGVSGEGRAEGMQKGRQYAIDLSQGTSNYTLVCVAGANYAAYVEAKGYDVITGAKLQTIDELERLFG